VSAGNSPAFAPCVVIPVYNHQGAIAAVVQSVLVHRVPVLLVDDGSDEACARELQRLAQLPLVTLLRHPANQGKGAAVCSGMRAAMAAGYTHALQVDADGQHTLTDVPHFIEAARSAPEAVVCGYPIFDASIPKVRFYGRYLTHAMVWLQTLSFEIKDSMCGFRLYPLAAVDRLLQRHRIGPRMDFDTDILVKLYWQGVPLRWLPTQVRYPLDGVSHFRMLRDNGRMAALHLRLLFGMVLRLPLLLARKLLRLNGQGRKGKQGVQA
jgi:glycosyltransferase involved in cell wall biosynthesis